MVATGQLDQPDSTPTITVGEPQLAPDDPVLAIWLAAGLAFVVARWFGAGFPVARLMDTITTRFTGLRSWIMVRRRLTTLRMDAIERASSAQPDVPTFAHGKRRYSDGRLTRLLVRNGDVLIRTARYDASGRARAPGGCGCVRFSPGWGRCC